MDPMRLRLLRELGDRGSVSAVAAALHVSASAVSQQLAILQASVGVPLTMKQGRTLVLTDAGRALAAAGTRVEEALVLARESVDAFLAHDAAPVRVSAFHSAGVALFGALLRSVGGDAVALSDADVARDEFVGLTADHDLVIAHRLAHDPAWPTERIVATSLFVEPLDIALAADHPLAASTALTPADLRGERWISTHDGFPLTGVLQTVAALSGAEPVIGHRVNEFYVAAQIVRAGAAIAVMPRITGRALAVDGMVLRPLAGATLSRHVDVLARPDSLARSAVRRVRGALVDVAADLAR
ncbi:LysR family transcriptional regulator [Microbacterium hominis]|uniref:LysR family transcriptional regulator n=1 Tax=Microbacterium hominis TaxID=162426 RepID=A0A0B4CFP3_9MICO|nr:LysR family transcriptional regulator [Microbacterium hominis]KIC60104.1 LysR family transcriptional regulator [Microbacterium hominis]